MVYIDWKRILALTPETFGEDEKEELMETVSWYSLSSEVNRKQLTALLMVLQEILKYKAEQVESLMSALDELAAKQGEEVARGRQELLDEIEELREQLEYQKRLERDSGASDDELRSELVRLEMQNEQLLLELQEREKDLVAEKAEGERLVGQVARLEREKFDLSRELSAIQEETSERRGRSISDSPDGSTEKVEELVEVVRHKNKHIMQLLDDVQAIEQDNNTLRVKLTTIRDQLTEANTTIAELTEQNTTLKIEIDEAKLKFIDLEDKNKALASQIDELIEKKAKNDQELDEFAIKLNERVEEWKGLLDSKDAEIFKLKEDLAKAHIQTPWNLTTLESDIKQKISEQETEITELKEKNQKIEKINEDLNETVEKLNYQITANENHIVATHKISQLQEKIDYLETQLKLIEDETLKKDKEISELVAQVRAYEREEFGLSDAMEKVKKLERRLMERDTKIESLVISCNQLGIEKGNLEDENLYFREKLGLSPTHVVDSPSVKSKSESNAQTVSELKKEIDKLNDEIIDIKLKNRDLELKLKSQTILQPKSKKHDESIESTFDQHLETRYLEIVEENDGLRKGLQEVLQSVQTQTMGELQAESLERLLEALDSRHISGWYHPAMRLQAELQTMKGESRELRNQIAELKKENFTLHRDTKAAKAVVIALEETVEQNSPNRKLSEEENKTKETDLEHRCIALDIELCKTKHALEKAESYWEKEKRELIKERDKLRGETFGKEINSSEGFSKTIEFFSFREETLENTLDKLKDNFLEREEASLNKIISLQKEKSDLLLKVQSLENQLLYTVPVEKLTSLEKEYKLLEIKNKTSMNFSFFSKMASNYISDLPCSSENYLLEEMKNLKAKLHETESQLNIFGDGVVTPDSFNNELSILSKKLASCEVQLTSEINKRTSFEKLCKDLKKSQQENEETMKELTKEIQNLSSSNLQLEETIVDIEDQFKRETLFDKESEIVKNLIKQCETLVVEKSNLEELLLVSRNQCKSLQSWRISKKNEKEALNEVLKFSSEKLAVAKMSQELVSEKNHNLELSKKNEESQAMNSKILSENMYLKSKIMTMMDEKTKAKIENLKHFKLLYGLLARLHSAVGDALCFPSVEKARKIFEKINEEKMEIAEKMKATEEAQNLAEIKNAELQVQLDALHDLKSAFQNDTKNLVSWHNKSTELRLKEARYSRENIFLTEQITSLEKQVQKLQIETSILEEAAIEREKAWDERQKEWVIAQRSVFDLINGKVHSQSLPNIESNTEEILLLENKVTSLEQKNSKLVQEIQQKEAVFREKLAETIGRPKSGLSVISPGPKAIFEFPEEAEKRALVVTISSLQAIIKQKEETIFRYQELLKKSKEENGNSTRRLQKELRNVHNALAMQSKAYSRMKHGVYQPATEDLEKYVKRVQELEEELNEMQGHLTRVSSELRASQREAEKLKDIAEQRSEQEELIRIRLEEELDRFREDSQSYQLELQQLRESSQGGQTQVLIDTITELHQKLSQSEVRSVASARRQSELSKDRKSETVEEDLLKRQLKASREECTRLREQVKSLQSIKRRPVSSKPSENKENLVDKIRKLEETLQLSKQHEQELEEKGLKRMQSVEQVTRWDERKRYQKSIEKLAAKLKQKEVEVTVALSKLDTMRGLMTKMERDKAMLEAQVRNLADSARESSRMEKLISEKADLAAQVAELEEEIAALRRHEGGKAAALLHAKLEENERKIASLELANKAPRVVAAELDRLKIRMETMEKLNAQLESGKINLQMNVEKLREENLELRDYGKRLETEIKVNKSARNSPSRAQIRNSYELQRELSKVKKELKDAREKMNLCVLRNAELEEQLHKMATQLSLWEDKDLADSLARRNEQAIVSELQQQLTQTKAQLAHKVHLLDRVKALLSKAAAKEKALNDKVIALQSMVPLD